VGLSTEDEAAWEYAKWGGPQAERYTIVWLVDGKHAHLRRSDTLEEARELLAKYRGAAKELGGGSYRILHTVTTTTEDWVE
jgi:hypothetical protein